MREALARMNSEPWIGCAQHLVEFGARLSYEKLRGARALERLHALVAKSLHEIIH